MVPRKGVPGAATYAGVAFSAASPYSSDGQTGVNISNAGGTHVTIAESAYSETHLVLTSATGARNIYLPHTTDGDSYGKLITNAGSYDVTVCVNDAQPSGFQTQPLAPGETAYFWFSSGGVYKVAKTSSSPTFVGAITITSFTSTTTTSSDGKITTVDGLISASTTGTTQATAFTSATLADEAVHAIDVIVTAIKSDGTAAAMYKRHYSGRRDGGTWTQLAAVSDNGTAETTSSWDCTLDVTSNQFRVRVTGDAGTVRWGIRYSIQSTVP